MAGNNATSGPEPLRTALLVDDETYRYMGVIIRHLCVGLFDHAVRVSLATSSGRIGPDTLGPASLVQHRPARWPFRRAAAQELIRQMSGAAPHVIHSFNANMTRLAFLLADHFEVPLVIQASSLEDVSSIARHHPTQRVHVVAETQAIYDRWAEIGGVWREALTLIRPGVAVPAQPARSSADVIVPTLVCITDLVPDSGVDRLLRAVRLLDDRGYKLLTFILGTGPEEDNLRRLCKTGNLQKVVTFSAPVIDPIGVLKGADFYILTQPPHRVSSHNLQAMAAGLVMVGFGPGISDALIDGQTASLCPTASPSRLADTIEALLGDPNLADQLARSAQQHIRSNHQLSVMSEQYVRIYRELAFHERTYSLDEGTWGD